MEITLKMNVNSVFPVAGLARAALAALAIALVPVGGSAQTTQDSVRVEIERLAALVDSLSREVERLKAAGAEAEATDALEDLRAAAAAAAAAGSAGNAPSSGDQEFVGRQRSLQALNPEISVNADVFGHLNPDDVDQDNFFAREFEISMISALDPYSRAALFISRHGAGPEIVPFAEGGDAHAHGHEGEGEDAHGAGGFGVEEGYVEWVSLPGGLGLKLGKFQQNLGKLNRWHAHALPFQSRSLPHLAFLGEEALSQSGASVSWLAPFGGGSAGTYEASVEVTRSENELLFGESSRPSLLTHVNGFWQFGSAVDFELSGSWLNGSYEDDHDFFDRNVYNTEFALNWIPPETSRQSGLTLRGGMMVLDGLPGHGDDHDEDEHEDEEHHDDEDEDDHGEEHEGDFESARGFWSMAELRLSPSWLIGARFDYVENPLDPEETQWLFSPTLTWWQSEFVRLRAEYDFMSGVHGEDGTGRFVLQVTFAMGPHKHATY